MKQTHKAIMFGTIYFGLCCLTTAQTLDGPNVLNTKTFEGVFKSNEDIPVGMSLGDEEQPSPLEVVQVRFETAYGNAWKAVVRVRWGGSDTATWCMSTELLDRQGRVLHYSNDRPTFFNTVAGTSKNFDSYLADIVLSPVNFKHRCHAWQFRLHVERLETDDQSDLENELTVHVKDDATGQSLDQAVLLVRTSGRPMCLYGGDSQGRFLVRAGDSITIEAQHGGYAALIAQLGGEEAMPVEYTLGLPAATRMGGIVQDEKGKPISHARVRCHANQWYESGRCNIDQVVMTNAQGKWMLDGVPKALNRVQLSLKHPQYRRAGGIYSIIGGADMKAVMALAHVETLVKGFSASGVVRDDQGRPVREATVHLMPQRNGRFEENFMHVLTDSLGRFSFGCGFASAQEGQASDHAATLLLVEAPGFMPAVKEVTLTKATLMVDFDMTVGRTLTGRVVDTNNVPVSEARVAAYPMADQPWYGTLRTRTDKEGRFVFHHVSDRVLVTVGRQGYTTVSKQALFPSDGESLICMKSAVHLTGKVTDVVTGKPIPDLKVAVCDPDQSEETHALNRLQWTSFKNGQYDKTLNQTVTGDRVLLVSARGYTLKRSKPFVPDRAMIEIDFALTPDVAVMAPIQTPSKGTTLKGIVLDPNGKPAPGVVLTARYSQVGATSLDDGSFKLVFPPEGQGGNRMADMSIIEARNLERNLAAAVDYRNLGEPPKIQLESAMCLKGKIQDANGLGIRSARIALIRWVSNMGFGQVQRIPIAEDGGFEIPCVARGYRYSLDAEAEGYGRDSVNIEASDERSVVDLPPIVLAVADQSVAGVVMDEDAKPVANVRVSVNGQGQQYLQTKTDEQGRFTLDGLISGEVTIQANRSESPRLHCRTKVQAGDSNLVITVFEIDSRGRRVPPKPKSLVGKALPDLAALSKDLSGIKAEGKPVFLCLVDIEQRPSRRCVSELAKQFGDFSDKGVVVVVVQVSRINLKEYEDWFKTNHVTMPIHGIDGNFDAQKLDWGVKSLPWLILADRAHKVVAEGIGVDDVVSSF